MTPAGRAAGGPNVVALSNTALVTTTPSTSDYRILNHGDAPAENVRIIVVTPLYVNTSTAGSLPSGCSMVLTDPDPGRAGNPRMCNRNHRPRSIQGAQDPGQSCTQRTGRRGDGTAITTSVPPASSLRGQPHPDPRTASNSPFQVSGLEKDRV